MLDVFYAVMGSAFAPEECAHQGCAVVGEDAGEDFGTRVEGGAGGENGVAAFGVGSAVYYAWNLRPGDGAGTHQTRFDSNV